MGIELDSIRETRRASLLHSFQERIHANAVRLVVGLEHMKGKPAEAPKTALSKSTLEKMAEGIGITDENGSPI
jgi:hypothetical protein